MPSQSLLSKSVRWDLVLFWLYLLLLVVLFGTSLNVVDPDLWHRLVVADYLFHTGHFAPGNALGYLGIPEVKPDIEWGSALVLYVTYILGGGTSLVLLKLVTLGTSLVIVVRAGLGSRPPSMLDAFFYCLVLLSLLPSFLSTIRSEASTHILFALWILWFQQERRGHRVSAWAYVLTMALWVNLHGGFILGIAWLGATAVITFFTGGDWLRQLRLLVLSLLATLANPFGYKLWGSIYEELSVPRPGFDEWEPVPWLHDMGHFASYKLLALWGVAVVCVHIYRVGWGKCDRAAVILLGLALIPSLAHVRHTSIFALVAGGLVPPLFLPEKSLHEIHEWKLWLHRFVVRAILIALPLVYAWRLMPANEGLHLVYPPDTCPVGAVDYLKRTDTTGNLLVGYNSGSYASWELRGQMRVSLSGRYVAIFTYATFQKVQRFFAAEDHWRDALAGPVPDAILVNRPDPVYPKMLVEPGWTEVYRDATHAVFRPATKETSP